MEKVIWHGAYGMRTPFDIEQHIYGCTSCEDDKQGYAELLEIRDAPEGKCGTVIHVFWDSGPWLYHEFDSMENARTAWELMSRSLYLNRDGKRLPGLIRTVLCGEPGVKEDARPWFYPDTDSEGDG